MGEPQGMNVSLPPGQERFVRAQVASGRYRSASEVVRDGLRLLEEAEQHRLLEKWVHEGLSDEEIAQLPPELLERAREHFRSLVEQGERSAAQNGWIEGTEALRRIADRMRSRRGKRRA